MKTLNLILKAKWYDLIASGVKKEEYREIKPYWIKRLTHCLFHVDKDHDYSQYKEFDTVKIHFGYTNKSMTFECLNVSIGKGKKEWGAPEGDVFIIKLGIRID